MAQVSAMESSSSALPASTRQAILICLNIKVAKISVHSRANQTGTDKDVQGVSCELCLLLKRLAWKVILALTGLHVIFLIEGIK